VAAPAPKAVEPTQASDAAVIGIAGLVTLYADKAMEQSAGQIGGGSTVTVTQLTPEAAQIADPSGARYWVCPGVLCTPGEYRRRESAHELPARVVPLAWRDNEITVRRGTELRIENGSVTWDPGDAFWTGSSLKGRVFMSTRSGDRQGNPDVIFLLTPDRELKKLPIWRPAPTD
jgi:hypothetical protein